MDMKSRITKNLITTFFGALLMFIAVAMLLLDRLPIIEGVDFSWLEMVGTAVLGWAFFTAKDTLLEGIFLNLFKIKSDG